MPFFDTHINVEFGINDIRLENCSACYDFVLARSSEFFQRRRLLRVVC